MHTGCALRHGWCDKVICAVLQNGLLRQYLWLPFRWDLFFFGCLGQDAPGWPGNCKNLNILGNRGLIYGGLDARKLLMKLV